jgi:membrane protein implicated in regulation of membrane protease activity
MSAILLDAMNGNLLLGFMPESLGLLIFGIALIFFAVVLRRVLSRNDERQAVGKFEQKTEKRN